MKQSKLDIILEKISSSDKIIFVRKSVFVPILGDFELVNLIVAPKVELSGSYIDQIRTLNALLSHISTLHYVGNVSKCFWNRRNTRYSEYRSTDEIVIGYVSWYEVVNRRLTNGRIALSCRTIRVYVYPNAESANSIIELDERDIQVPLRVLQVPKNDNEPFVGCRC